MFSFYGDKVNVTALPFPPYWLETDNGYYGTDYLLLATVAQALNFNIRVLPTANWGEVVRVFSSHLTFVHS